MPRIRNITTYFNDQRSTKVWVAVGRVNKNTWIQGPVGQDFWWLDTFVFPVASRKRRISVCIQWIVCAGHWWTLDFHAIATSELACMWTQWTVVKGAGCSCYPCCMWEIEPNLTFCICQSVKWSWMKVTEPTARVAWKLEASPKMWIPCGQICQTL